VEVEINGEEIDTKNKLLVVEVKHLTPKLADEISEALRKNPDFIICDNRFHFYTIDKYNDVELIRYDNKKKWWEFWK
jgi:hypothetical protein